MNNLLEKKPFYKKAWFWVIIVIILVIGFGSQGGNTTSSKDKGEEVSNTETNEKKSYKMGDKVVVGDLEFVVTKTSVSSTVGNQYLNQKAKGKYLIVDVKVTNKGKEKVYLGSSNFKIKNADMTFEPDTTAGIYLDKKAFLFEDLNPQSTMKGKIVFDMAEKFAESKDNKLEVTDGIFDGEALVILN